MMMMMLTTMGATFIFCNIFLIISLQIVNTLESGRYIVLLFYFSLVMSEIGVPLL